MSSWSPLSALDLVKHLVDGWMDEYRGEGKLSLVQSKSVQMTALWRSDAVFQLYYGYGNSDLHLEATEVNILYFLCVCPGLRCVTLGPAPPGCLQPRHACVGAETLFVSPAALIRSLAHPCTLLMGESHGADTLSV